MKTDYIVKEETLTEIADAIREKTGSTEDIAIEDFAESIKNISNIENSIKTCNVEVQSIKTTIRTWRALTYENNQFKLIDNSGVDSHTNNEASTSIYFPNVVCGTEILMAFTYVCVPVVSFDNTYLTDVSNEYTLNWGVKIFRISDSVAPNTTLKIIWEEID